MPLFAWKDEYSVAVERLDEDHKKLFRLLNELYETTMQIKGAIDPLPVIDQLREYSQYHFLAEEQYMRDCAFAELAAHRESHRDFKRRIDDLYLQCRDNRSDATRDLIVLLGNWLLHHVLEEDRRYSTFKKDDDR